MGSVISSGASHVLSAPNGAARCRPARGFTLLEMLVVIVIAGITLDLVSFNAMPSEKQVLANEAQRIGLLMQLARDEAIVRNQLVAFKADEQRYRFLVRNEGVWEGITQDDMLREREFKRAPVTLTPSSPTVEQNNPMRIVFGREPVDKPFVLTLSSGESAASIRADGIGHFTAE